MDRAVAMHSKAHKTVVVGHWLMNELSELASTLEDVIIEGQQLRGEIGKVAEEVAVACGISIDDYRAHLVHRRSQPGAQN